MDRPTDSRTRARDVIYMFLIAALCPLAAHSHHAFRVVYDFSKTETLEGRVMKLELVNPHSRIFINVTSENGDVEEWLIEGPGRLALERRGWSPDTLSVGDQVHSLPGGRMAWWSPSTRKVG